MNRLICMLLCAFLAISLLTACGSTGSENSDAAENSESGKKSDANYLADKKFDTNDFLEEYDTNFLYYKSPWGCETQDAYYMFSMYGSPQSLVFYDKASGIADYLCAKPECLHDTLDCNAAMSNALCICYYDGRIYWVGSDTTGNDYLYSCASDGSDRKQIALVREMPSSHQMSYHNRFMFCHRGYCYFAYETATVEDGTNLSATYFCAISLKTGEKYDILEDKTDQSAFGPMADFCVQPVGNDIYIISKDWSAEKTGDVYPLILRIFHTKTRELETVCSFTPSGNPSMGNIKITPEMDIYFGTDSEDSDGNHGYNIEKLIPEESRSEVVLSVERKYSMLFAEDFVLELPTVEEDGTVNLEAWDYDGNPISLGTPKFDTDSGILYKEFDNQTIWLYPCSIKDGIFFGETSNNFFVRFALDGSFAEVVWDGRPDDIK